eukprot:PhF_6_TR27151/c0_g1_i1/m.39659
MTGFKSWPSGFTKGNMAFSGGVSDGTWMWMAPYMANAVVKVHLQNGSMVKYDQWPRGYTKGNNSFVGIVYNGGRVFLVPSLANALVELRTTNATSVPTTATPTAINQTTIPASPTRTSV